MQEQHQQADSDEQALADGAYRVEMIDTKAGFAQISDAWRALQASDPEAHFFLSYIWMHVLFDRYPGAWAVYVVYANGVEPPVCIFPVQIKSRSNGSAHTISPAGRLTLSEYTGFLCDPAHETPALQALARHVAGHDWQRFSMRYEPTQRRGQIFADAFPSDRFRVRWKSYKINDGKIDCLGSGPIN